MKTAISLPDDLFHSADLLAEKLGTTRSNLYAVALAEYVAKHCDDEVTARLNAVYGETASEFDPAIRQIQGRIFTADQW